MQWGMVDLERYKEEIERRKKYCQYELSGDDGTCFIIDNEILKIYWSKASKISRCDMSKYESNRIAFPKYYIQDNMYYYGEVMPYFPYEELENSVDLNTKLNKFMGHYYIIQSEIAKYPNIHMTDIGFIGNILYSSLNGFYLIDTTFWEDEEWSYTTRGNIRRFDGALFNVICSLIGINISSDIHNIKDDYQTIIGSNDGKELLEIIGANLKLNYDFKAFIISLQNVIRKYFNKSLETVGDIKKYNKKLKGL